MLDVIAFGCSAFIAGYFSGVWWPGNTLVGAIAGMLGGLCYLGVKAELGRIAHG